MGIELNQLTDEINKALSEYSDEIADKVDNIVGEISNDICRELKSVSPKRTGKYKKGWRVTVKGRKRGNKSVVVHNKEYRLTYVLENGHEIRKVKKGESIGSVKPILHIKPVEEKYVEQFIKKVEEAVNET